MGEASLIFIRTNPFHCYLSLSVRYLCFCCCCCLFIYISTISISIICVSQEEPGLWLLQVNNFWKEQMLWKVDFWYQWIIHLITGGVNIYSYGCVSLLAPECCVCLCVWYQIEVPVKNHILCQTSVNLMPFCIKHTWKPFWY